MKRIVYYLSLTLFPLVSCQNSTEKEFTFNPNQSKQYQVKLSSNSTNIEYKITCSFKKENSTISMHSTLDEIQNIGNSEMDKEINREYQNYINSTSTSVYDNFGKPVLTESDEKKIINPDLLVIEYPQKKIKEGDSWKGVKSAKPDFVFENIATNFRLRKIQADNNIIDVEMIFVMGDNSDPMLKSMTKSYKGSYIVNDDGTVKNAELAITGFSGFSNIKGKLKIEEIK